MCSLKNMCIIVWLPVCDYSTMGHYTHTTTSWFTTHMHTPLPSWVECSTLTRYFLASLITMCCGTSLCAVFNSCTKGQCFLQNHWCIPQPHHNSCSNIPSCTWNHIWTSCHGWPHGISSHANEWVSVCEGRHTGACNSNSSNLQIITSHELSMWWG